MNNYIPINKAVNPVCIYQGDEPLISKMLGVDEMIYGFDGTPSDYATCVGAPEMFIKVEEDGLYYFGVEADDTGSLTIAGEQAIKKDGTPPNGKLNIETDSRYLKAGYYKVALSWTNNAYTPASNNAAAFNVTMDREPIQAGKYEGNSTMKREFRRPPKSNCGRLRRNPLSPVSHPRKWNWNLRNRNPSIWKGMVAAM
ncbi:MAG: PA14 domain-containing protein [Akkermansia muciniphila]